MFEIIGNVVIHHDIEDAILAATQADKHYCTTMSARGEEVDVKTRKKWWPLSTA